MDYSRDGDVVRILTGPQTNNNNNENWGSDPSLDQSMWATEDEYGAWNRETSVDATSSHSFSSTEPPNKKPRPSQTGDSRAKAIGKMFFKTKLCCKFRAGTCPYITNCNFAHSIEELRRPPPNWQDIVAGHEEERESREEFQIPSMVSSPFAVDSQRSFKGRHCKKFFTEEGCPYGDSCTFLHDEQSKTRESVAISLGPGSGGNYGNNTTTTNNSNNNAGGVNLKPSNWKTRICNKWELTGYCPFGSKCHFAHGAQELHRYGGGLMETEARDSGGLAPLEVKQGVVTSKNPTDTTVAPLTSVPYADPHHISGVPSQRLSNAVIPRIGRAGQKWKGPDKISRIYGDWIDDFE